MIPPKQTVYRGVLFRSLLESRWAELLDELGHRWDYEPKAFHSLQSGSYLPDFYLPDLGMWAEVKPTKLDELAMRKVMELSARTGEDTILMEGSPQRGILRAVGVSPDMENMDNYVGVELKSFVLRRCS